MRGAFTGAVRARTARFEVADGGTSFVDEIGDLPLDTEVKLLRVLQERESEPAGSSQPRRVDVRVIPPLRERAGDVAVLAYSRAGLGVLPVATASVGA